MPERAHIRFNNESEPERFPPKFVISQDHCTPTRFKKRKRAENQPNSLLNKPQTANPSPKTLSQNPKSSNGTGYAPRRQPNGVNTNGPFNLNRHSHGNPKWDNKDMRGQYGHPIRKKEALLPIRKALPIWSHAAEIKEGLRGSKDVMLLVGETGSGKSTQVPQFLLDEPWCKGCIAITQPRRVAAISLARRVAEEMGTLLGSSSPSSKVGYSVRFDNSASPNTRIKFLTEGMLLQEMLRDPWLKQYSAVIVDEVHERSVNVDLLLGFLRSLVTGDKKGRNGMPLKVVVMSATADTESLFKFFNAGYQKRKPKHIRNANSIDHMPNGTEDSESSWSGISSSEDEKPKEKSLKTPQAKRSPQSNTNGNVNHSLESTDFVSKFISTCYIEGRQYPVKIFYLPEPTQDFVEAALKSIFQIHYKEPLPGDVLVFLTGQDTVEALERLVNEYSLGMEADVPKVGSGSSSLVHVQVSATKFRAHFKGSKVNIVCIILVMLYSFGFVPSKPLTEIRS